MKLTKNQTDLYNENGYLILENFLTEYETDLLIQEIPKTIEHRSPRVIYESNGSIRSIFAPHSTSKIFEKLSRFRRIVLPAQQLLGNSIYLHQYKINIKKGLEGDWWEWHQDFPYWHLDDGIEEPNLVSIMLYLQDTDASNGALMMIPKSHNSGIADFEQKINLPISDDLNTVESKYLSSLNSNLKFTIDKDTIKMLCEQNGMITASGKKGSAVFFHSNIFHASNINLTPYDRQAVIITYNSISNIPKKIDKPRPDFLSGRIYLSPTICDSIEN